MKKRIRSLIRDGWSLVEIPLSVSDDSIAQELINLGKYKVLCRWCQDNVPTDDWLSSCVGGRVYNRRSQRFVFKDEKYAVWFKLITIDNNKEPTQS